MRLRALHIGPPVVGRMLAALAAIVAFGAEADPGQAAPAIPPLEVGKPLPCPRNWVWEQSRRVFPETPGQVFDLAELSGGVEQRVNAELEAGKLGVTTEIARAMEEGEMRPATVTIAAKQSTLLRILWRLDTRDLHKKRLPYLNVHIISEPGNEKQIQNIFAQYEAHVAFTVLTLPDCAEAPAR